MLEAERKFLTVKLAFNGSYDQLPEPPPYRSDAAAVRKIGGKVDYFYVRLQ